VKEAMAMSRLRRSMLFIPGNNPGMMQDAHIYGSDALMFDLEDSVTLQEKDAARMLVYQALKTIDYNSVERVVRINPLSTPFGTEDVEAMIRAGAQVLRMPKTEMARDVQDLEVLIARVEEASGIPVGSTAIIAAIESALGVVNAWEIARASRRLVALAFGAEDFTANMKTSRSKEGTELLQARAQIVLAARAAGIDAIDTVFSDLNDMDGLVRETQLIKQLGFDGKSVINPRQIKPVHQVFTPTAEEIEKARRIVKALRQAEAKGSGVVALDGRMIDRPVVLRAQRIIELAKASYVTFAEEEDR
jgi:citrate lyase subunit beta/citryl-CoA lyase